jgi:hypothetical protein
MVETARRRRTTIARVENITLLYGGRCVNSVICRGRDERGIMNGMGASFARGKRLTNDEFD